MFHVRTASQIYDSLPRSKSNRDIRSRWKICRISRIQQNLANRLNRLQKWIFLTLKLFLYSHFNVLPSYLRKGATSRQGLTEPVSAQGQMRKDFVWRKPGFLFFSSRFLFDLIVTYSVYSTQTQTHCADTKSDQLNRKRSKSATDRQCDENYFLGRNTVSSLFFGQLKILQKHVTDKTG